MAESSSPELPEKVRELRKRRGMSQQDLAAAADVAVNTVWALEKGRLRPRARTLRRLAAALGVPFEALLEGEPGRAAGVRDHLDEYLRARAAGRLSGPRVEHLRHLVERLVDAEIEGAGGGRRMRERSPGYGADRAAEEPLDRDGE